MQKIKMYFNKVQIIDEILSTIMVILIPIISDNKFVSLGWFFIGLTCFGDGMFTKKWSIIGRTWNKKQDSNYKTQLSREYSDKSFLAVGILGIILCPVALFETIFSENYIAMVIAYIVSTIILIVLFILTDKENKKIEQLIPKIRK